MSSAILDGLQLVDAMGLAILGATLAVLVLGFLVTLFLHGRFASIERDLVRNGGAEPSFRHPVLQRIVEEARAAYRQAPEPNTQAIIEESFHARLRPLLLAERFVKSATGLVIILGLLGTFYGLTLSIGRLVHLVAADPAATPDVSQAVTSGLTHALSGMAVAFSNSLVGVASAVLLTILGILANVTDRRTGLMLRIETYVDRALATPAAAAPRGMAGFGDSVARLERAVGTFEAALQGFAGSTRDFREFNLHLKDNVQRLSLTFADFSDRLRAEIASLKSPGGR